MTDGELISRRFAARREFEANRTKGLYFIDRMIAEAEQIIADPTIPEEIKAIEQRFLTKLLPKRERFAGIGRGQR